MPYDSNGIEVRVGDWVEVCGTYARVVEVSGEKVCWSRRPDAYRDGSGVTYGPVTIIDPPADRPRKPAFSDAELRALGFAHESGVYHLGDDRWIGLIPAAKYFAVNGPMGYYVPLPFPESLDDLKTLIRLLGVG